MSNTIELPTRKEPEVDMVEDIGGIDPEKVSDDRLKQFVEAEKQMSIWQAAKAHKRVLSYCIVAYLCGMTYGYDVIANGATIAMPAFLISFGAVTPEGSLYAPSIWTSLWASLTNVGQAIGSFVAGPLAQRFGRRYSIMIFALVTVPGVALQYTASTRGELLGGKILNGFAVGGLLAVGTTWASDVAPTKLRAPILQGLVFFTVFMQAVSLGIVRAFVPDIKPSAWKIVFAIQWIVGGLPLLAFFVPESPVWLVSRGRLQNAVDALDQLYGKDNDNSIRLQLIQETLALEQTEEKNASFFECFKGTNLKRTLTVALLFLGNGLIGSAFLSQNIYFLLTAGLPAIHSFDIGMGGFFLACIAIALGWFLNDKIGRRSLWLVGVFGNIIGMVIIGSLAYAKSSQALWAIAIVMNLLISWQVATCFNTAWVMAPEISSYRLRQHSQSIGYIVQAIVSWFFQFTVPYMYNIDAGNLGAKTGFIFAGCSVVLFGISWYMIPETSNLTVEDIDLAYLEKISPRRFTEFRSEAVST